MIQEKHISFRRILLTAVLSVSTLFLPGCAASRPSDSGSGSASNAGSGSKTLQFEKIAPVSIAAALKNRDQESAQDLLDGFDWFYGNSIGNDPNLEYMPEGAVRITDISDLDGEWQVTHFRSIDKNWQKQLLKAVLKTNGKNVSYTETWQYIFYKDGTLEDARAAASDLPYKGTAETNPLTVSLTEEYFNNKLTLTSIYEYNGFIYAVGSYYSDYDKDYGYAAMYKASAHPFASSSPAPAAAQKPKTETVSPKKTGGTASEDEVTARPETVPAPSGLEFLEGTWKGGNYYFTIRFLDNGQLYFIRYSTEPLGEDTGFGGLNAHYVTYSSCDYTFDSAKNAVSFSDGTSKNESFVIERVSDGSLKVQSKQSGESIVNSAEEPDVFVLAKQ